MKQKYDIVIIGAGPGGYHTAIHAAKSGKKTAIIEKGQFGGTCLNFGCMPTKIMLDGAAGVLDTPAYLNSSLDISELFRQRDKAVQQLSAGVEMLLKSRKVDIYIGEGRFVNDSLVSIDCGDGIEQLIEFEYAVIASGSSAKELSVLEKCKNHIINSDAATNMHEVPKSVCIIGGGVIGVEFSYIYTALGCKVYIVEALERILIHEDPLVSEYISSELMEKGIEIITNASIDAVEDAGEQVELQIAGKTVRAEKILCATGRQPDCRNLNLESLGMDMIGEHGEIKTDEFFETACSNIFAIGDVNGKLMLAHAASSQGMVVLEKIINHKKVKWDPNIVPKCVYIEPEIASVGLSETEAAVNYNNCKSALYPMEVNGKAIALGKTKGFIKVITDENDVVLGVTIVGEKATELITIATEAIKNKMTVDQIKSTVYPHPAFAEALQEAILKVNDMAVHF